MLITSQGRKAYSEMVQPWKRRDNKPSIDDIMRVTPEIAALMPALAAPPMSDEARALFREIITDERPRGGTEYEYLNLAWARGFCAHPCDWVPSSEAGDGFPLLYQPWAIWLAQEGYTPFYSGVPLTAENFDTWTPHARRRAFQHLQHENRPAAHDLLLTVVTKKAAAIRLDMLMALGAVGLFSGNYPSDVPIIQFFLDDPSAKVRAEAATKLEKMGRLLTEEDFARAVAKYFTLTNSQSGNGFQGFLQRMVPKQAQKPTGPKYLISPDILKLVKYRSFYCTSLDAVASVLGLSPYDMVEDFDLVFFQGPLYPLFMSVKDMDAKKLLSRRLAKAGKHCPPKLFRDADNETWDMGLRANLANNDLVPGAIFDFVCKQAGSLELDMVRQMRAYRYMKSTNQAGLKTGKQHKYVGDDPLRILALVASKDASLALLKEACAAGLPHESPRLAPLKLNLLL